MDMDNNLPVVLCRYQKQDDIQFLLDQFANHFNVIPAASDAYAKQLLDQDKLRINSFIITQDALPANEIFNLLLHPAVHGDQCLKMVLSEDISVEQISELLKRQALDCCVSKNMDFDFIISKIFQYKLRSDTEPLSWANRVVACEPALLIVDDEVHATKYLKKQLEHMQGEFVVYTASCAEEALRLMARPDLDVAVFLTDQRMPGVNGKELLKQVKTEYPSAVRMLTSAYNEVGVAMDAVNEDGLFRYITKPWNPEEVITHVRQGIQFRKSRQYQAEKDQKKIVQKFKGVLKYRKARIRDQLDHFLPDSFTQHLDAFFDLIAEVSVLDPGVWMLSAKELSKIETELVEKFVEEIRKQICKLQPGGEYNKEITEVLLRKLLVPSLLEYRELDIDETGTQLRISNPMHTELRLYSHILGPVKRVSEQLVEQQASLFLLLTLWQIWQGEIQFTGYHQAYDLCLIMNVTSPGSGFHVQ